MSLKITSYRYINIFIFCYYGFSGYPVCAKTSSEQKLIKTQPVSHLDLPTIYSSNDGKSTAKLIGFMQLDGVYQNDEKYDHPDGSSLTRARLGVTGKFSERWGYKLLYEFGGKRPQVQDFFISYKPFKSTQFKLGQFKEPIGLEWHSAAKDWNMTELPLVAALTPRRAIGFGATIQKNKLRFDMAVFKQETLRNQVAHAGSSFDLNTTYLISKNKIGYLHIGSSVSYRLPNSTTKTLAFKSKHETSVTDKPTLNTGSITNVNDSLLAGVEVLFIKNQWSVQTEYFKHNINRINSFDDAKLDGYYLQTGYFLSNGSRKFNFSKHAFTSVSPEVPFSDNSFGALEVTLRLENLNFDDAPISAGQYKRTTLGLNWFPVDKIRITTNISKISSTENAAIPLDKTTTLAIRAQFIL